MKKKLSTLFIMLSLSLLPGCAGVTGNIEKYTFPNTTSESLKNALDKVYSKFPELIKEDTIMYGNNNDTKYYFKITSEGKVYVFLCNTVVYDPPYDKDVDLSLTSATEWGKNMKLASNIGFFEKRKYRRLFEKNILNKVKNELNTR